MTYIVKGNKKLLTKMANSDCSGKYKVAIIAAFLLYFWLTIWITFFENQ